MSSAARPDIEQPDGSAQSLPVCAQSQTSASTDSVDPVLHGLTVGRKGQLE